MANSEADNATRPAAHLWCHSSCPLYFTNAHCILAGAEPHKPEPENGHQEADPAKHDTGQQCPHHADTARLCAHRALGTPLARWCRCRGCRRRVQPRMSRARNSLRASRHRGAAQRPTRLAGQRGAGRSCRAPAQVGNRPLRCPLKQRRGTPLHRPAPMPPALLNRHCDSNVN